MGAIIRIVVVILVAAFLHSVSAALKRYPYPFDCQKHYIRLTDTSFSLNTCPGRYYFNQNTELCQNGMPSCQYIAYASDPYCNSSRLEYYCNTQDTRFTYCTPDNLKIVDNGPCPSGGCNDCLANPPCR